MQFKIDENLPVELAELLARAGHNAKTVNDQKLKGAQDSHLINLCKKENRAFITFDADFSDINAYPPEEYNGIIVLRLGSQSKKHVLKIFQGIIQNLDKESLLQNLWIVEETLIRIRGKENFKKDKEK